MGTLRKDLTGKRFDRLVVVKFAHRDAGNKAHWLCRCDCGRESVVQGYNLTGGQTTSCGCKKNTNPAILRHGMSKTLVHSKWRGMLTRCTNPKAESYPLYGGRGIRVCDRWLTFENFYEDMGTPPEGSSIERIDNDGNYEPGNCRWATSTEQGRNKRNNRVVTIDGIAMPVSAAAELLGIPVKRIYARLALGWSDEMIAASRYSRGRGQTTPPRRSASTNL